MCALEASRPVSCEKPGCKAMEYQGSSESCSYGREDLRRKRKRSEKRMAQCVDSSSSKQGAPEGCGESVPGCRAAPDPPGGPALDSVFMRTPGPCSKPCSELGVNRFLFLAFQRSFDSCLPVVRLEYVIPCEGGGRKLDSQTNGAAPKMTNPLRRAL